ncbi:acyltransferase family protein [Aeromonas caviae]
MNVNQSDSPQPLSQPKAFRHDINGLRAWAVVAVVLYHFGIPGFSGGFVGVDVFFVISGFLMTGIIIAGFERGNFSLLDFYLSRARRIIPALLVLCLVLMVMGWFWLPSVEYKLLGTDAATAISFISNLTSLRGAGYFGGDSHEKWLLHTWSLSVEWQFYVLLPLALMLVWRWFGKQGVKIALWVGGIASLSLCIYVTWLSGAWLKAAFYLLPTRAWEMIAGGGIWWLCRNIHLSASSSRFVELLGIGLILAAVFGFDGSMAWPGAYALVPVVGAMLVLAANSQTSWLTNNGLMQRLGTSSYSLYLWHWPLVVALNYAGETDNSIWIAIGLLFTLVLGELSLRLIENPCRRMLTQRSFLQNMLGLGFAVIAVGLMAVGVHYQEVEGRLPERVELVANEKTNFNPMRDKGCHLGPRQGIESPLCQFGSGEPKVIVMGDSHANAVVSGVGVAASEQQGSAVEVTYSACPTLLGDLTDFELDKDCRPFNNKYFAKLADGTFNNIPLIIVNVGLSNYFVGEQKLKLKQEYHHNLIKTVCQLTEDRPVYLVRPFPGMAVNVPVKMSHNLMLGHKDSRISITLEDYHQHNAVVWSAQDEAAEKCGAKILDPLPYFCHDGRCWGDKDGRPIYYDGGHLNEFGNKLLVPMFREVFIERNAGMPKTRA